VWRECVEGVCGGSVWRECVRSAGSDSGECNERGIDKGVSGKKALYTHGSF
jgi:hypothetical protein